MRRHRPTRTRCVATRSGPHTGREQRGRTRVASSAAASSSMTDKAVSIRNPFATCDAPPPASAPNAATPIAPPACRAVFNTADAMPARSGATDASTAVVIAGTANPMPDGISRNGASSMPSGVDASTKCSDP
ncbi:hypothetical protein WS95_23200 [Burkholderia sp. MSMB1826]|nr:hypothetical protein WS95_23200 [Burkholderia sp. MSMB1826]